MIEELKAIGLGNYEAKALEVLMTEKLSLRELSKKARVPFGKIYSVVKSLKEKNIVKETNSRPKLVYVDNASEVISMLLKDKQDRERKLSEKLRLLSSEIDKNKGKESKFFEVGVSSDERKKLQLRVFNESEEEIMQIFNMFHNPKINRQSKTEYEKAIENAIKRGLKIKAIYPENIELPPTLKKLAKEGKFKIKRLDNNFTRTDIVDNKKVLIKLQQKDLVNSGGSIFIENERLAENLKKIFNEMWGQAR